MGGSYSFGWGVRRARDEAAVGRRSDNEKLEGMAIQAERAFCEERI